MIIVISGPSGVGKSSIIKELSVNEDLYFCVSSTTRPIRSNEVEGIDYKYIDNDQFKSMIDQDLKDGISKPEMAIKYGIKPWEVDEMFKHPFLKGRRPSRKKALSFVFEDDITDTGFSKHILGILASSSICTNSNSHLKISSYHFCF